MDILVYAGPGVSATCLRHTIASLKQFLTSYAIRPVQPSDLNSGLWQDNCALFVMPGGADVPYTQQKCLLQLKQYVSNGGSYLGLCAGAYFACDNIEFAPDDPALRVVGERPLKFFNGTAKGPSFPGFKYNSEEGAKIVDLCSSPSDEVVWAYFNGGCTFISNSHQHKALSHYKQLDSAQAIVFTSTGRGKAILSGAHIEFPLTSEPALSLLKDISAEELNRRETARKSYWGTLLRHLGLHAFESTAHSCTPIHAICGIPSPRTSLECLFVSKGSEHKFYSGEGCSFELRNSSDTIHNAFSGTEEPSIPFSVEDFCSNDGFGPDSEVCPQRLMSRLKGQTPLLLFSDVTTSTQDILKKNLSLLNACPDHTVFLANQQISGRGRTSNSWSSPRGCLLFSTVAKLPSTVSAAKAVFAQYLMAMAIPLSLDKHVLRQTGLKLKWPNDLYVESRGQLRKIGGIVVDSQVNSEGGFDLVVGVGFNFSNTGPNACLKDLIPESGEIKLDVESFLAGILLKWWAMWQQFVDSNGNFEIFLSEYLDLWLHSDQEIVETSSGQTLRLTGISTTNGFLQGTPTIYKRDMRTGQLITPFTVEIMPDGNSFNMMKGLISAKM